MPQKVRTAKSEGKCNGCNKTIQKKGLKTFTRNGCKVFVCGKCGYHNAPSIFFDYVDMPKQQLVFGQPVKPTRFQKKYAL